MPIDILPNGRFPIPEILEMPFSGQECPICDLLFTDMTEQSVFQEHQVRCMERKVEDNKQMIAAGYKQTSKGWVLK